MNQKRSGSISYCDHQRAHLRVIAGQPVVAADEDEAVIAVDVALVDFGQPDVILDPLVRHDAADEQEVDQAVGQDLLQRRAARRAGDPLGVHRNRQHAGALEAERLELLAVELGVAERQIDAAGQRRQLAAAERREAKHAGIVGREKPRRRDVVVLQDAHAASAANASVIGDGSAK